MAVERSVLLNTTETIVCRFGVGIVSDLEAVFVLGTSGVFGNDGRGVLHTVAHLGHRVLLAVSFVGGSGQGAVNLHSDLSVEGHDVVLSGRVVEVAFGGAHE